MAFTRAKLVSEKDMHEQEMESIIEKFNMKIRNQEIHIRYL